MSSQQVSDTKIKIAGMGVLWSLGYVLRTEVLLKERVHATSNYLDLTDVDVVGYAFSPLLQMETVGIDCGSGGNRSPINRAFWTRGVMEAIGLRQAICIVGQATKEEHRIAAEKMGVALMSSDEFRHLSSALVGGVTVPDFAGYYKSNSDWIAWLGKNDAEFYDYVVNEGWSREWDRMPVVLPGLMRRWNVRLTASKEAHQFTFLEVGTLLSISLVRLASFIILARPDDLAASVYNNILGGGRRAGMVQALAKKIEEITGKRTNGQDELPLRETTASIEFSVPHFNELLDLIGRFVNRAASARQVPRYLQAFQLARIDGPVTDFARFLGHPADPIAVKLALDLLKYLKNSGDCRPDIMDAVTGV